jgi:hypothetical protein
VCWLLTGLCSSGALAETPKATAPSGSAPGSPDAGVPSVGVPTYWVMMVTGEKDGQPWMKTTTPETLGGTVKGTGPWTCTYPATLRGGDADFAFEENEVACSLGGEQEAFVALRCGYRTKAKPGKLAGKAWKRSDLQTLNLRRKGDPRSIITVSLRCDVDAAFSVD